MRGTLLIAIAALLVGATGTADAKQSGAGNVAVAQELKPAEQPKAESFQVDGEAARQTSTVQQAEQAGAVVQPAKESGLTATVGGLPLTGLDMLVILGAALVLAGTGFAVARLSQPY